MENKWYIGQEILCIKTHSEGLVKKGEIYTIKGLQKSNCKCHEIEIDVGVIGDSSLGECLVCNTTFKKSISIWWFSEKLFVPLEYNQEEINELIKEIKVEKWN